MASVDHTAAHQRGPALLNGRTHAHPAHPPFDGDVVAPIIDAEFGVVPPHHLREYLHVLSKRRVLVAQCFAVTVGLVMLVTLVVPRQYTASTRVQVARQSPIQPRLQHNVQRIDEGEGGAVASPTFVATQVAALQSRDLAERVIRTYRLSDNPAFVTPRRGEGLLAVSDSMLAFLRPRGIEPAPAMSVDVDAAAEIDPRLLDRYMKYLRVADVRGTDLIEVAFTTPRPTLSAFLAAAHTQAFIDANTDARRATSAVATDFLDHQVAEARKQTERAEEALADFAAEHASVAVDQEQKTVTARITELSTLLTKAEATRATLESRDEFLTRPAADPLTFLLDQQGVQKVRLALLDARAQKAALRQRLGPNHPDMQAIAQVEAELSEQLRAEVAQGVAAVRSHYDAAVLREERLRRKLTQQEEAGTAVRALGARYDLLKRDVDGARRLHASLVKQRMETAVNAELVPPTVRVIERAEVPRRPSRPKIPLNLVLGVFSGMVVAAGAAFGREYFDSSVKSSADVEELLQLPTLAAIPNFAIARGAAEARASIRRPAAVGGGDELMVLHEPWSRVAEAFRSMRTAVLFATPSGPPKVILITSATAAEGKTVASLNLASALAESGTRVLLIDADLRRPRCHASLGVDGERGLSTWLAGEADLASLVRPLSPAGFFFVPAGPPPPNPAELVCSVRMRLAIEMLSEQFDVVLLDTPPVLPVADAVVLAREADGVVLVVKGDDTPRELVRRARDRLAVAGAAFLGVIVNNVGLEWGDPYFYDTYGYYRPGPGKESRV